MSKLRSIIRFFWGNVKPQKLQQVSRVYLVSPAQAQPIRAMFVNGELWKW